MSGSPRARIAEDKLELTLTPALIGENFASSIAAPIPFERTAPNTILIDSAFTEVASTQKIVACRELTAQP